MSLVCILSAVIFLFGSCRKEPDTNAVVTDPVYLKGLLKRAEFYNGAEPQPLVEYVNYSYDSLKRISKLNRSTVFDGGTGGVCK